MMIYGAYKEVPKNYYIQDGTFREYRKFFQTELDCVRYCIKHDMKYDSIFIEPDSKELMRDHYDFGRASQLAAMGH